MTAVTDRIREIVIITLGAVMRDEPQPKDAVPLAVPSAPKKMKKTLVSILALLFGFSIGWRILKPAPPQQYEWEDRTIAPRIAVLRQRLAEIRSRPANTIADYIGNTLETWPMVDEAKGLIRLQMGMIARFKQANQNNASDLKMADYMMRLTETDEQLIYLLADEIDCAKKIKSLPVSERLAYYNANVPPIKNKEVHVVQEFSAIVKDAKANGVPLPSEVDQLKLVGTRPK